MKIIYEPLKKTLEVNGVVYYHVDHPAYCAFVNSPNPEYHLMKYIDPVYLKEDRCVMYGGK